MAGTSINEHKFAEAQDRTRSKELSILTVALNLAAESQTMPSEELKTLAFSALQFVQISSSYYAEMKDWSKLPDELIKLKTCYDNNKYDFLETRFDLNQADEIQGLLEIISGIRGKKEYFSESEITLLNSISIYREHFSEWVNRTGTKLPKFWFVESCEPDYENAFNFGAEINHPSGECSDWQKKTHQCLPDGCLLNSWLKDDEPQTEAMSSEAIATEKPVKGKNFEHAETTAWKTKARKIGKEWMEQQRKDGDNPGVIAIAKYVEGELSTLGITGKHGKFLDFETIKREALTGITGKPANGKRKNHHKLTGDSPAVKTIPQHET